MKGWLLAPRWTTAVCPGLLLLLMLLLPLVAGLRARETGARTRRRPGGLPVARRHGAFRRMTMDLLLLLMLRLAR